MVDLIEKWTKRMVGGLNHVAAFSLTAMMVLICMDVCLRCLRHPVPGAYEMAGFLGAVTASFALAQTSLDRGHVAVSFLVNKLPARSCLFIESTNDFLCAILFAFISRQSLIYALELQTAGEVSPTLRFPLFPFVMGIGVGCGALSLVLLSRAVVLNWPQKGGA